MKQRRVVITGLGIVSPLGIGLEPNWRNILAGKSGIGPITHFDASGFPCTIAGEVKDFDPTRYLSEKEARKMDRFMQLGMAAGIEAFKDSGLQVTDANAERIGVHIGSGIGGLQTSENGTRTLIEKGQRRISPRYIPMTILNMVSGNLSSCSASRDPTWRWSRPARPPRTRSVTPVASSAATPTPWWPAVPGCSDAHRRGRLRQRQGAVDAQRRPGDRQPPMGQGPRFVLGEGAGVVVLEGTTRQTARASTASYPVSA